jgi:hypothetical protein
MKLKFALVAVAALMLAPGVSHADSSIGGVENSRAKERQGAYLNREDRDNLRRYGGSNGGYRYYRPYAYDDGYYDGYGAPGISVYGPGYGFSIGY